MYVSSVPGNGASYRRRILIEDAERTVPAGFRTAAVPRDNRTHIEGTSNNRLVFHSSPQHSLRVAYFAGLYVGFVPVGFRNK